LETNTAIVESFKAGILPVITCCATCECVCREVSHYKRAPERTSVERQKLEKCERLCSKFY